MGRKLIVVALCVVGAGLTSCTPESVETYTEVARDPNVHPDSFGAVIPPNIAPLNFQVREPGQAYLAKIHGPAGEAITVASRNGSIRIAPKQWRALLAANEGQAIRVDVFVQGSDGTWQKFQSLTNTVASEPIDQTLVFRQMKPIFNWWKHIGIYQRDLTGFNRSVLLHGRSFGDGCLNCHTFVGNKPETLTIGLRSAQYGSSTLLVQGDRADKIGSKWGYTTWHPSGRLAVYSLSKVRQFFHRGGPQVRDVVDLDSALACYKVDREEVVCPPVLSDKDRLETYPTFSPDGKYLYFCSGPFLWTDRDTVPPANYEKLKYDLCRVSYDIDSDTWGSIETVLSAEQTGLSILLPRISPDGKFLLFCMCQYGCFPIYQRSSDLYLMDLATGSYRKLGINSEFSESWHSWSSNSRWIAFSSKRWGGFFTRTFLSYVDASGMVHQPIVVPQEDPGYYDALLETYSAPELVNGEVPVGKVALARASRSQATIAADPPISGATPKAKPIESWQERE